MLAPGNIAPWIYIPAKAVTHVGLLLLFIIIFLILLNLTSQVRLRQLLLAVLSELLDPHRLVLFALILL